MKNQELINAIGVLAGSIDALVRAKKETEITIVITKMLELIAKLNQTKH